jgi:subtilase family serine protease
MSHSPRIAGPHPLRNAVAAVLLSLATLRASFADELRPAAQQLHSHVRAVVRDGRAVPVGVVDAEQRLNLVLQLPAREDEALAALIARQSDPDSPDYHRWLSVEEFTARFGRTEDEYRRVAEFARAHGLLVDYEAPNRLFMVVHGAARDVESALNVRLLTYRHPSEDRVFFSPDREPALALDVPVLHVAGLSDYDRPHPGARAGTPPPGGAAAATGSGPAGTYLASDMRAAYAMGANTGSGQVVGLVEFSGYDPADIAAYFAAAHAVNRVPIVDVVVDGGSATQAANASDEGEVCLDIEQVLGIAPGLRQLRVYIGPPEFGSGVDVYLFGRIVSDNIAKQVSNSWWWSPEDPASDDPLFQEAAAQGQSIVSISGDNGAYVGDDGVDMGWPAEDAYLTIVGGTSLRTTGAGGAWSSEVVWNSGGHGSGGGPADDGGLHFALPAWQKPAVNAQNHGSTALRNSPDVALHADYNNYVCFDGGCAGNWGGTSFAAPRWAAFLALVNEQVVAAGHPAGLGFLNPTLYKIGAGASYPQNFHDVVAGDNDTDGQVRYYSAVRGYDLATGWGSMIGTALMDSLVGILK